MAEWWAFKPIGTAFDRTSKLLLEPFDAWTWLKLIVIVFFVGGGASRVGGNFSNLFNYVLSPSDMSGIGRGTGTILSDTTLVLVILGVAALAVALALLFAYLHNVFSFVFLRALASGDVRVIGPFMDNLGRGFRLFVFTLAAGIITLAVDVILVLAIVLCALLVIKVGVADIVGLIVLLLAIIVAIVLFLALVAFSVAAAIFIGFTYDFVAPMVLFKGTGIVEAWGQLWASIKKDWRQYAVYALTYWALEIGLGIVLLFIELPVALIFIAVLFFGALVALVAAKTSVALAVLIGLVLLAVLAVFILVMMVISMPAAVYFRYYALDVLKRIDPAAVVYSGRFAPSPPVPPA